MRHADSVVDRGRRSPGLRRSGSGRAGPGRSPDLDVRLGPPERPADPPPPAWGAAATATTSTSSLSQPVISTRP
ncbi:MAG: hypothetical protein MZV70_29415 [Desulfobacterales bacterium]|nr:hypothetical protein [Desulfobacterales bacterium]